MTYGRLLNHTSGIRSFTELSAFQARDRLDVPAESLVAIFQHEPLDFRPGTGFHYNNSAFYVLGLVIAKVSGQPYGEYLRDHVLAPLGLRATYSCDDAPIIPHRAHCGSVLVTSLVSRVSMVPARLRSPSLWNGAGSAWQSPFQQCIDISAVMCLRLNAPLRSACCSPAGALRPIA